MGLIYVIRCSETPKVYIGQTTETLQRRWIKHKSDAKQYARYLNGEVDKPPRKRGTCSHLYRAMNAYGIDKFTMELLEEMDDDLLDAAETQYISEFDSVKNGYNLKEGGDRSAHSEETRQVISERTRIGIAENVNSYRTHDILEGLPVHCVYIKRRSGIAVSRHPLCKWRLFAIKKYGTVDETKRAVVEFLNELEHNSVPYVKA